VSRCFVSSALRPTSPRVLGCGDVQAVGQPAVTQMGVAGLLKEDVPAEAESVVNGDCHGADNGEDIS